MPDCVMYFLQEKNLYVNTANVPSIRRNYRITQSSHVSIYVK